jgi:phosphoribosyl 1,2-cyclic phosphodiesterase
MIITFLGTGSAIPIPRLKSDGSVHDCPQCRSEDSRDRRSPSALLIDHRILVDAPPMILDLLSSVGTRPAKIKALLLTHRHNDAAGGLKLLPKGIKLLFPRFPGRVSAAGHEFTAVKVPHDRRTWGYLIDETLTYFSDYSDIRPAIPVLKRASVAILDGSGWDRAFPTHQPMVSVIKQLRQFVRLKRIFFTHIGHTKIPHLELERKARQLGDERFTIAYHGLKLEV